MEEFTVDSGQKSFMPPHIYRICKYIPFFMYLLPTVCGEGLSNLANLVCTLSLFTHRPQATLQFCIMKPVVAVATIILEATGLYHEGVLK